MIDVPYKAFKFAEKKGIGIRTEKQIKRTL